MTKLKNGGRSIIINDTVIDVISSYTPTWDIITVDGDYYDENGKKSEKNAGYNFKLSVSTYGLSPQAYKELTAALMVEELTLSCAEYTGNVRLADISTTLDNDNFYGTYYTVDFTLAADELTTSAKISGITINDVNVPVDGEYSVTWVKEVGDEFETSEGRKCINIKGYRFGMSAVSAALPTDKAQAILGELKSEAVVLGCDEYSGEVNVTSITQARKITAADKVYYVLEFSLEAVDIDTSLGTANTITVNGVTVGIHNQYDVSWQKETGESFTTWDGRTIETVRGWRFSISAETYAMTEEEMEELRIQLMAAELNLVCNEYSGEVRCSSISPVVTKTKGNTYYYTMKIDLEAAVLDTTHSGSL